MPVSNSISPGRTVNETVRLAPRTLPVLKSFGIDTCCGGAATLSEAAARHGLDPDALLAALAHAVEAEG